MDLRPAIKEAVVALPGNLPGLVSKFMGYIETGNGFDVPDYGRVFTDHRRTRAIVSELILADLTCVRSSTSRSKLDVPAFMIYLDEYQDPYVERLLQAASEKCRPALREPMVNVAFGFVGLHAVLRSQNESVFTSLQNEDSVAPLNDAVDTYSRRVLEPVSKELLEHFQTVSEPTPDRPPE